MALSQLSPLTENAPFIPWPQDEGGFQPIARPAARLVSRNAHDALMNNHFSRERRIESD